MLQATVLSSSVVTKDVTILVASKDFSLLVPSVFQRQSNKSGSQLLIDKKPHHFSWKKETALGISGSDSRVCEEQRCEENDVNREDVFGPCILHRGASLYPLAGISRGSRFR